MRFGSLFTGIGGIDLGLERAGMECAWQVEIDDYATKVLEKHWPNVPRFRDVRECGACNLPSVDLIAGGFPCQPHSLAGKRAASADERDLWGEFFRIIRELKPRWVVAENVPGLLSSEAGRFFGRVLRDLASLGFHIEWECLPASAFGAPHRRDRVFIIAHAEGERRREARELRPDEPQEWSPGGGEDVADSSIDGREPRGESDAPEGKTGREFNRGGCSGDIPNSTSERLERKIWKGIFRAKGERKPSRSDWWAVEPGIRRVVDGIPSRVDRLRGLGNAVVPEKSEYIGRRILDFQL